MISCSAPNAQRRNTGPPKLHRTAQNSTVNHHTAASTMSKAHVKTVLSPAEYDAANRHMKDRLLDALARSLGSIVSVTTANGNIVTGVLYSIESIHANDTLPGVVLKFPTSGNEGSNDVFDDELMTVQSSAIKLIVCKDVPLTPLDQPVSASAPASSTPAPVSPATSSSTSVAMTPPIADVAAKKGFRIDTDISNAAAKFKERKLERWTPPDVKLEDLKQKPKSATTAAGAGAGVKASPTTTAATTTTSYSESLKKRKPMPALPLLNDSLEALESQSSSGAWDQFQANKERFGVDAHFDENEYTTRLNTSDPKYKERLKTAEKLAKEIEAQSSSNIHLSEERGQKTELDDLVDEEDKYSGVLREKEASEKALMGLLRSDKPIAKTAAGDVSFSAPGQAQAQAPAKATVTASVTATESKLPEKPTLVEEEKKEVPLKQENNATSIPAATTTTATAIDSTVRAAPTETKSAPVPTSTQAPSPASVPAAAPLTSVTPTSDNDSNPKLAGKLVEQKSKPPPFSPKTATVKASPTYSPASSAPSITTASNSSNKRQELP